MAGKYAFFTTDKIKDWATGCRLINHTERTGKPLPLNADPARAKLNKHLFRDTGFEAAKRRWLRQTNGIRMGFPRFSGHPGGWGI